MCPNVVSKDMSRIPRLFLSRLMTVQDISAQVTTVVIDKAILRRLSNVDFCLKYI